MDKVERAADTVIWLSTPFPNAIEVMNSFNMVGSQYYLVEEDERTFFVLVNYKEGYMESRRMRENRSFRQGDKFTVGDIVLTYGCKVK